MISLETWMILAPLQKLPKNVGDLGKLIVAKGFKKLPKVQKLPTLVTLLSLFLFPIFSFDKISPCKDSNQIDQPTTLNLFRLKYKRDPHIFFQIEIISMVYRSKVEWIEIQ